MPQLVSFDGIDVYMYFKDHAPPHVHAFHGEDEALILIRDGSIYAGSLPSNKLAALRAWVAANAVELLARWGAFGGA